MTRDDLFQRLVYAVRPYAEAPSPETLAETEMLVSAVCDELARSKIKPVSLYVQVDRRDGRAIGTRPYPPWALVLQAFVQARREVIAARPKVGMLTPPAQGPEST